MSVAVPQIKYLEVKSEALSCCSHTFHCITDSLNCYLVATVCLTVLKCIANLLLRPVPKNFFKLFESSPKIIA